MPRAPPCPAPPRPTHLAVLLAVERVAERGGQRVAHAAAGREVHVAARRGGRAGGAGCVGRRQRDPPPPPHSTQPTAQPAAPRSAMGVLTSRRPRPCPPSAWFPAAWPGPPADGAAAPEGDDRWRRHASLACGVQQRRHPAVRPAAFPSRLSHEAPRTAARVLLPPRTHRDVERRLRHRLPRLLQRPVLLHWLVVVVQDGVGQAAAGQHTGERGWSRHDGLQRNPAAAAAAAARARAATNEAPRRRPCGPPVAARLAAERPAIGGVPGRGRVGGRSEGGAGATGGGCLAAPTRLLPPFALPALT